MRGPASLRSKRLLLLLDGVRRPPRIYARQWRRLNRRWAINPYHPAAVSAKGRIFLAQRNFAAALEAFERAIELNPSHPDYRQLVGMAKIFLGRAEEALESLNEAIRLSPRDLHIADYSMCLGVAYWDLERYPDALNWFERSKAQNSWIEATKFFLASTYLRLGEQERQTPRSGTYSKPNPIGRPNSWNHLIRYGQPV
jgi:tetratricopeptide (TPR) repeat protein